MTNQEQSITALVELLPEVYQPIFKHPEFTAQASRSCLDRLETITSVYDYIAKQKGRPLKVLDLGCAQGFFSLNLAERGAIVTAVDYSQPNVDVCNKLAEENSGFNVEFLLGSIETIIQERIKEQEYDLVLGLSVFHHLVYEHGAEFVFDLFTILSKKVETGIFEFALNTEPLYWAESQPEEPRKLIESFTFNHHLSMYGTHLSAVERPLFFASNKYWNVENQFGVIDHFMQRSHQLDNRYHGNNRRYYFSDNKIIKIFLENENSCDHLELRNESLFLKKEVPGFRSSELLCYGSNASESWLVRTAVPGRLLLDIILNGDDYDDEKIISDILNQVTILEKNGLYHNDLRPWNILIGDDEQVYLIDYGSITEFVTDGDDLYGQMLSFFVLIKEIAQHKIRAQGSQRPPFVSPYDFPEKYKRWMTKVWMIPSQKWNFESVYLAYQDKSDAVGDIPVAAILESYLSTATNHMDWQVKQLQSNFSSKIDSLTHDIRSENKALSEEILKKEYQYLNLVNQLSSRMDKTATGYNEQSLAENDLRFAESEARIEMQQATSRVLTEEKSNLMAEVDTQRKIVEDLRNELNLVYSCNSWKITYPLRIMSKGIKLIFSPCRLLSAIKSRFKKKSKGLVSAASGFISNRPFLKQRAVRLLNRYPGLKYKIKRSLPRNYDDTPSVPVFIGSKVSEDHSVKTEQQQFCSVKTPGVHEKQKSVLESWLY
ncbi:class I SAM-dependent methyltransferase [Serratia proteamaculans]|uniref:class I SAM-dependent methyltransferase n=1 Tax=Serratia proteamaculans TaxID=28151 RepID=UPI00217AEACC|nr:class I SAM-dependent methyltransferase [Serratia proteamaculans]CAI0899264.1 3-demethylubiquinone-9 3-methyltransferase [Serratia proteamaculans]CAI0960256.1 3-demethylubiquinone-9 3-methyltransferase [Serratia proteamaculans]CAI1870803.1 3-demethylubiquinone-9 3-methyltransferase [Serratia proteamaculans]